MRSAPGTRPGSFAGMVTAPSAASAVASTPARARLESIDVVRGAVMVLMALDHTRDFVHNVAFRFDPTDLTQTTTVLFLTRWVTHFCAPTFVFLAGVAAYLQRARGATTAELSRFLFTRGLWLVVLEFTAVRIGTWFNLDYTFLGVMQVIWVIGVSMVTLAGLVHLPITATATFGIGMIVLHNLLDGIRVTSWQGPGSPVPDAADRLWMILHQGNEFFPLFTWPGPVVFLIYPLVPWIGVMAAGYAFGRVYDLDAARRRRILTLTGTAFVLAFIVVRATNIYGDPAPWRPQPTALFTLLSFVNTTKYPPSLLFLLMTLGPMLLVLAWLEPKRMEHRAARALVTFGRVPLFFYLLQWPLAHALAIGISLLAGKDVAYYFMSPPAFFTAAPPDSGFELWTVYVCWVIVVSVLYVLCTWYADVKRRHPASLLRYL
jgi:uncharacterized membrane protein